MLSGTPKGSLGAIGRKATMMSSSGFIRTVSFQPSSLGSGGLTCAVPVDPVDHLHVEQVEVDRVGVHAVVRDLPDLGAVGRGPDRGHPRIGVSVDDLGGRVVVAVGDGRLVAAVGERQLDAEEGGHPARSRSRTALDGLRLDDGDRSPRRSACQVERLEGQRRALDPRVGVVPVDGKLAL